MASITSFIAGFSEPEKTRIETHLRKLIPHLILDQIAIVGGLSIRYHLTCAGIKYPKRPFNDLDLIALNATSVLPTVIRQFLIEHYHPQKGNSFYIVLIDPESKTKVDVFDHTQNTKDYIQVPFYSHTLNMITAENQLVKIILDILKVADYLKVDPKQFQDANLMMNIANIYKAEKIWKNKNLSKYPISIIQAFKEAERFAKKHPELLVEKPFRKPKPYNCPDCINTLDFPLTPMEKIQKVLGYIE